MTAADPRADYTDDQAVGAAVRHRVWGPAVSLIVIGWVGIVGGFAAAAVGLAVLLGMVSTGLSDSELLFGLLTVFGLIIVAWSAVIAFGGHRMLRCRNRDLAVTGAVFCILTVVTIGVLILPIFLFGVWALWVLTRPDVKAEFTRVRRARAGEEP